MKIDASLRDRVKADLDLLNNVAAAKAFPPPDSLSQALNRVIPAASKKAPGARNITTDTAQMFTTAAVDMWMRAVHSFLISGSLTAVSPIWASVVGYYSSHYSVRAFAHLLGFFRLFTRRRMAHLDSQHGRHVCRFNAKTGREHEIYWTIVKEDPHFIADPFFPSNNSDVAHRDWANYADHLPQFRPFRPLDKDALKARIERISEIPFALPPIPQVTKFPDVDSVQIVAYHRIVRFRDLVDAIQGGRNRFWDVHRNPSWAAEFMDFQLSEGRTLHSEFTV
jgi:hypothetical protein